jgi:hypothetical protein
VAVQCGSVYHLSNLEFRKQWEVLAIFKHDSIQFWSCTFGKSVENELDTCVVP